MTSLIKFEIEGPIGRLILNNPENLNAMTVPMGEAIEAVVPKINQEKDLRVVIIQGAGRAFSAGGDFDFILKHTEQSPEQNQKEMLAFYSRFLCLRKIEVPTIAMINGHAIGAGFLIALACDLRFAAQGAKLATNFAKIGLSSGMGGLYSLVRLAGPAHAADLLLTGRLIQSEEAQAMGLINGALAPEQLEGHVLKVAQEIAANAPVAVKIMKRGIQEAAVATLNEVLNYESQGQAQTFATQDLLEGIEAIRSKRSPKFTGK